MRHVNITQTKSLVKNANGCGSTCLWEQSVAKTQIAHFLAIVNLKDLAKTISAKEEENDN
jgi:hypothetical protein